MKDRPGLEIKGLRLRAIDLGAGDVAGQQVGCELNAFEFAFDVIGQCIDRFGLGQTGGAFNQQMPISQKCEQ